MPRFQSVRAFQLTFRIGDIEFIILCTSFHLFLVQSMRAERFCGFIFQNCDIPFSSQLRCNWIVNENHTIFSNNFNALPFDGWFHIWKKLRVIFMRKNEIRGTHTIEQNRTMNFVAIIHSSTTTFLSFSPSLPLPLFHYLYTCKMMKSFSFWYFY